MTFSRDGRVYRVQASEGAEPEDVSAALDALAPSAENDGFLNVSPAGDWLLLHTDRFDPACEGWPCLALVAGDLSAAEPVRAGAEAVHPEGMAAVASGGNRIVFAGTIGPHAIDLFVIERSGDAWTAPALLTADSAHDYNAYPAISDDGASVVFDCGPTQYGMEGTNVCRVGTDGNGLQEVALTTDAPAGLPNAVAVHHPDFAPDGSIVYEGNYDGEQIWRRNGADEPVRVPGPAEGSTDNSPCVLPDGRVVTVTYAAPIAGGGQGEHELKIIDGDQSFMLVRGGDILDEGIGCGGSIGGDAPGGDTPRVGRYFPDDAVWYQRVDDAPRDASSDAVIGWLENNGSWGTGQMRIDFSIEVLTADASTPLVPFVATEDHFTPDCDADPVPLPDDGAIEGESGYRCEGEGDCHLIVVHEPSQTLYEMWRANVEGETFFGGCLATWDMTRTYGADGRGENCTSADAAGFPIAPLLFTADEVAAGSIDHAIRFILPNERIRNGEYVHPATHSTGATSGPASSPPYGGRFRLRADFPLDTLPSEGARVVARAMQRYGMLLSDAGNLALTAQSDRTSEAKWEGLLDTYDLSGLRADDFELVEMGATVPYTGDCVRN